jgi:dTDP-4-dehydrorhamnose reductase
MGCRGQLGQALTKVLHRAQVLALDYPEVDMTLPTIIEQVCQFEPDLVINAAAWTAVDAAEENPDPCYAVNVTGVQHLALACQRCQATLVHISTNEVFPGNPGTFYREWDPTGARSGVYARSKEAGEKVVQMLLAGRFYIVRTAWLYNHGGTNFITKILAAAAQSRPLAEPDNPGRSIPTKRGLRVVADEFGNPTYAVDLAEAIVRLIATKNYGIYHFINSGYCSRYQLARELLRLSGQLEVQVSPISSAEWPRRTMPPPHALLLNTAGKALGISLRPWQEGLAAYFKRERQLAEQG